MKKIMISILLVLGTFSMASAEVGVKIGVSGMVGVFEADGFEKEGTETNKSKNGEEILLGMGSVFVEKTLDFIPLEFFSRVSIGFDHVPHEMKSGAQSRTEDDLLGENDVPNNSPGDEVNFTKNTASATVDNFNTVYAVVDLVESPVGGVYVKAGYVEADVTTTETLGTGSKYGNTSIDGYVAAIGLHNQTDNGMFFRIELNYMELDGDTLTSTTNADNKITLDSVEGNGVRLSFGKAF